MTCEEFELELPSDLSPLGAFHLAQCKRCQLTKQALSLAVVPLAYDTGRQRSLKRVFVPGLAVAAAAALFLVMNKPDSDAVSVLAPETPMQLVQEAPPQLDLLEEEVFSEASWAIDDEDEVADDDVDVSEAGYAFEI